MKEIITSAYDWLIRRPSYMLLTASPQRLAAQRPGRFAQAWVGLLILSLLTGLGLVGIWGLAWRLFRDFGVLTMPAAVTALAMALWPMRRATVALADALGGEKATGRALAAAALLILLMMCLLRLQANDYRGEFPLPWWINWIRPAEKIYRALLLMPIWGGWAMMVIPQFCRPGERTEPAVAAMAAGCGPLAAAACMGGLLTMTITYFAFLPWWQLSISVATALGAIASGGILCRLSGGLTRRALLASNLATQLVFIMAYLANQ